MNSAGSLPPCYNGGMGGAAGDESDRDALRAAEELRESLFDAFLDAVSEGRDEPAAEFLARHGVSDTTFVARLEAIRGARGAFPAGEDPWLGRSLGGFRIDSLLGEGGMGIVYRATDLALERQVAIKLLRPEVAGAAAAQARFEREARAIARLRHPNIVSLLSIGAAEGVRFIAMELVDGRPLDELIAEARGRNEPIAPQRIVRWARDVADALQCAHDHGIVHRDVKPSNVLVTAADDRAMLVDFGIAREPGRAGNRAVTLTEGFIGSPYAMAPERIGVRRAGALPDDPISDVYGVGVLLWECLAGRPPFEAPTLERLLHAILNEDPPRLRSIAPRISADLETVTMKAMEKDSLRRYPTAAALRDDLDALLAFRPIAARPDGILRALLRRARRRRTLIATVGLAIVAASALLILQRSALIRDRERNAEEALREASVHVDRLHDAIEAAFDVESRYAVVAPRRLERFLSDAEDRELDSLDAEVLRRRRERDAHVDRTLELLAAAERLGAAPAEVTRVRRSLHVAQFEDARRRRDDAAAGTLRRLVRESDPDGSVTAELERGARLEISVDPPDAAAYLYRIVEEREVTPDGEPRLVPAPFRTPSSLPAGGWAIEVLGDGESLRAHDCLVGVGGHRVADLGREPGASATLADASTAERVTDGGVETVSLGARDRALPCRLTTRPMPRIAAARLTEPSIETAVGDYVLALDAPGRETVRIPLRSDRRDVQTFHVVLPRPDEAPAGFLPIFTSASSAIDCWMMEREVTMGEYLEFVNDPTSLSAIEASGSTVIVPRSLVEGVHCPRRADGGFALPPDWTNEWPALGISWNDASAYAAWLTRRGQSRGESWTYELPTFTEWMQACARTASATFITGSAWRPKWIASVFATERATPLPVMRMPRDESTIGVHDLMGSVSEYVDDWWREDVGHRRHAGGAWAFGDPDQFRSYAGNGRPATSPSDTVGIRLVVRRHRAPPP